MVTFFLSLALLLLILYYHFINWQPRDTSFLYKDHPYLLFGHRGAPQKEPENTLASFQQAISDGCNAIELDLLISRDGHLIVFHDETLERTTDGSGKVVDQTLAQLQNLNAAHLWPGKQAKIPTLQNVIDIIPEDIILNVEIKNYSVLSNQAIEKELIRFIKENDLAHRIIVSSFNPFNLWKMKYLDASIITALLWFKPSWWSPRHILGLHIAHPDLIHPSQEDITPILKFWARQKNLQMHTWVVNDAERMLELKKDHDLKGMMSDDPELLVNTLSGDTQ